MPDDLSERQSRLAIQLYTTFRAELDTLPLGGRFMPYRWWSLPDPIGVLWMPYAEMLGEFATGLVSIVNRLTNHVRTRQTLVAISIVGVPDEARACSQLRELLAKRLAKRKL